MKLKPKQICPLHHRRNCCGRESLAAKAKKPIWVTIEPGVKVNMEDGRQKRSPSAMHRLLERKVKDQCCLCGICDEAFTDVREIVPDHKEPRGMGGARRDDSPSNIQAAHSLCNLEKGSKRT